MVTPPLPVIYLLSTHLRSEELHELEARIPTLTYDINEAELVVGKITQKKRALFELRNLKLETEELPPTESLILPGQEARHDAADTDSDTASDGKVEDHVSVSDATRTAFFGSPDSIKVVKLAWLTETLRSGNVEPLDGYLLYEGRKTSSGSGLQPKREAPHAPAPPTPKVEEILNRAKADVGFGQTSQHHHFAPSQGSGSSWRRNRDFHEARIKPPMLHQSTTEHDLDQHLPPIPDYLHTTYSCQRPTPLHPPNEPFIKELMKIRVHRTLEGDKIGVRAYSSSIATLSAYPYTLSSAQEVARLPGCGMKIALLYQEYKDTGQLSEVTEADADPRISVLKVFYEIWGVAETTAREFYNRGWRDLDDIVEYGWNTLTRVQQIGVKYYDEFLMKIPRDEVASISNIILEHANKIQPGFEMIIVGGYRRGKKESGDVDLVLSHRDKKATLGFVEKIVLSLEATKHITHTLILSTKNSERGQEPVAWKGNEKKAGTGFDTLDKALVVWQDPLWNPTEEVKKNPNPHRRVDIIIAPWKTAGCAVLGWTSGTTFQRDLRRYCKKERALKFDSSGVRSRVDGSWVDLESGPDGKPAPDMLTAEKRIFAGLGLEWREPWERCTG
jgi:DNA polymerase IV